MRTSPHSDDPDFDRPSRSVRRREALDVLAFAKQLSELPPARIAKLELPDAVRAELADVQRTPSHIAHKRQLAHLAKVMRAHADEEFAVARASLANERAAGVREAAALHHIETLRENLLGENGDALLADFLASHPGADRQRLRALIRQARSEREKGTPPRACRELFRVLREVDKTNPATD